MMELTAIPLDDVELFGLHEDADLWEEIWHREIARAAADATAKALLESIYGEADREAAFDRFRAGLEFATILRLFQIFRVSQDQPLVEIGGGSGFLSWALSQSGYRHVCLLEPNPHFVTGTGYLRSRSDSQAIRIENSLDRWYEDSQIYQTVVTRSCIHHFRNIAWTAACIRQKVAPGGLWIMMREPYVYDARSLYQFLQTHPYSQQHGIYEFAYPPAHYIESLELAGFRLQAVVPARFANDSLSLYATEEGNKWTRRWTRFVECFLLRSPHASVLAYQIERRIPGWGHCGKGYFSRPQLCVFERLEVGSLDPQTIWYPRHTAATPRTVRVRPPLRASA